jgi:glycosyltransferase involved in cell wall biosynthesis
MHIVLLTDLERSGGATIAARRTAEALVEAGASITQLVHHVENSVSSWQIEPLNDPTFSLSRKIERRLLPKTVSQKREDKCASAALASQLKELQPDIVNVHNLHSAARFGWRWNLLETALQFAPTIWTLHDQWSFTGRCAYSYDCPLFLTGCDARCPTPTEYPPLEPSLIASAWNSRRAFFEQNKDVVALCPSQWLAEKARQGLWAPRRVEVIAYCLSLDVFKPENQIAARQTLGLSELHGPLFLASATSWNDKRKGAAILTAALEQPIWRDQSKTITIATLGEGSLEVPANVRAISLGVVNDERVLALAYAAADFFVHPALADNLPNVVLESLSCGTPVVALPVGGLPELVIENQSGFLADAATPPALARALVRALQTSAAQKLMMRANCRNFAATHFSPPQQAARTLALFEELIEKRKGRRV